MVIVLNSVWVGARRQRDAAHIIHQRWALQDISLRVEPGERVAVLGANGSGKTSLLRTLSQVYLPERGRAEVRGRVAAVVDLAPGVERDLTGYEVLPIRAALVGMSGGAFSRRRAEILDLAGIDQATLAAPLLRWSMGTLLRLEFALAVCMRPAVLIIDEVLAAADWTFRQRALGIMEGLSVDGTAVVFATHDLDLVTDFADRAIVMNQGRVELDGPAGPVIEHLRATGRGPAQVSTQWHWTSALVESQEGS